MRASQPGDRAKAYSATRRPQFQLISRLPLGAAFDAGRLTSDGGLVWLSEADQALGICEALAGCVPEWRRGAVLHSLPTLVRQRILQIACGYADQNDAATLRSDPLLKAVCGRLPESGPDLASQPTLSRLENAVDRHACEAMAEAVVALYIRQRDRKSTRLNSSHVRISYAVFCLKKKSTTMTATPTCQIKKARKTKISET